MKATIDNITIEGTPQEVYDFIKLYKVNKTTIISQPITQPYTPWKTYFGDPVPNPYTVGDPPLTYSSIKSDNTNKVKGETNE